MIFIDFVLCTLSELLSYPRIVYVFTQKCNNNQKQLDDITIAVHND